MANMDNYDKQAIKKEKRYVESETLKINLKLSSAYKNRKKIIIKKCPKITSLSYLGA